MKTPGQVENLMAELHSSEPVRRMNARRALEMIGRPAVFALVAAMSDSDDRVRWEACKTLAGIGDPRAADALVKALRDKTEEVQWVAAEALIALGRGAVIPVLQALEADFRSLGLRQGAHHVLHALEREHKLTGKTQAVVDALREIGPRVEVAVAARAALASLRKTRG